MQITLTNLGAVTPDEAEETLQTVTDFLKGLNLEKLITPVSYTHLDVYKRQAPGGGKPGRSAGEPAS